MFALCSRATTNTTCKHVTWPRESSRVCSRPSVRLFLVQASSSVSSLARLLHLGGSRFKFGADAFFAHLKRRFWLKTFCTLWRRLVGTQERVCAANAEYGSDRCLEFSTKRAGFRSAGLARAAPPNTKLHGTRVTRPRADLIGCCKVECWCGLVGVCPCLRAQRSQASVPRKERFSEKRRRQELGLINLGRKTSESLVQSAVVCWSERAKDGAC